MSNPQEIVGWRERQIRFVDTPAKDDIVLLRVEDPAPRYAVLVQGQESEASGESFEVAVLPLQEAPADFTEWLQAASEPDSTAPVYVKYRGVELLWQPGRAVLQCDVDKEETLLPAVAEFAHYEHELRSIEQEVAGAWAELEEDDTLAFDVTPADLRRSGIVGERMQRTLRRRMRLARIEPHLYAPDVKLPAAAQKLGEALREQAETEARLEIIDGKLEVFEHIYEMSAQRMGEYRASHSSNIMEWVIIVLLAAETLFMAVQAIWK